jgi:hypothetical protein
MANLGVTPADGFLEHWNSLPKVGVMPHLRSFLDNARPEFQPSVAIVDVLPEGEFKARLVGTGRVALYEHDMTHQNPLQAFSDEAKPVVAMLARQTVNHPCGSRVSQVIITSKGRELLGETIAVPLEVDTLDAQCFAHFQHVLDPLKHDEKAIQVARIDHYTWIDIGAGIPDHQ